MVGVELYAADYVGFVPSGTFPPNTILSLAFDIYDDDQNWDSDNILMRCHVVGYGVDENDPIEVHDVDMGQSEFPGYQNKLYHHVPDFASDVNLVHTVVSSMENEPRTSGQYPMRSYTIKATAVPEVVSVSGSIDQDTWWRSGQTVIVIEGLSVSAGRTLTIEPGVTVKFGFGYGIMVAGTLDARGNSALPITFTSLQSQPEPGDWLGILTSGPNDGLLWIEHCIVECAHNGVKVTNSQPHRMKNNMFRLCSEKGLWITKIGTDPVVIAEPITGNTFEDNEYGAYLDEVTVETFNENVFLNNVTGMYMEESSITDADGFRDLSFADNQTGLCVVHPAGTPSNLTSSTFEGHSDCAIYYNRQGGSGDLWMSDLTVVDGNPVLSAGIRTQGGGTMPTLRHCDIRSFMGGPLAPDIGISCTMLGTVDAGTTEDYGHNRFLDNECDIEYSTRSASPALYAVGNCWDQEGGLPEFCGKSTEYIYWDPSDCKGWGGFGTPPLPEEPIIAGLSIVYPNPLQDGVRIDYGIPETAASSEGGTRVALRIYDLSGHLIRELVKDHRLPGTYSVEWDGKNEHGQSVSAGTYVCRLETDSLVDSKRIVIIRRHPASR